MRLIPMEGQIIINRLVCLLVDIQANLEKVLEKRGGQFFAGNCLTWAELHFLQLVDLISTQNPKVEN